FAAEPLVGDIPEAAKVDIQAHRAVWLQWVGGGSLRCAPLKPAYRDFLFTGGGDIPLQWHPKNRTHHGNHRPYRLPDEKGKPLLWLKPYPEQPSSEYLVAALDSRLGVYGVPGQQLVALHHAPMVLPDGTPTGQQITQSAVLISQHAGTKENSLHTILKEKPATLAQLDFTAFARTLIRVLLTNPEDDKGDDYFLVPLPGTDRYGLQRIDNERAFFPAEKLAPGARPSQAELLVKSVIYCLDW